MKWTDAETAEAHAMLDRGATESEFQAALGRTKICAKARINRVEWLNSRCRRMPPQDPVPAEVQAERLRRAMAPQPAFGDPPVGFSALDRKRASGASA